MKFLKVITIASICLLSASSLYANDGKKRSSSGDDSFTVVRQKSFDFSDAIIDGKYKSPDGFFLQGRDAQRMRQMVKLRSNFKRELRNSEAGVRSAVR